MEPSWSLTMLMKKPWCISGWWRGSHSTRRLVRPSIRLINIWSWSSVQTIEKCGTFQWMQLVAFTATATPVCLSGDNIDVSPSSCLHQFPGDLSCWQTGAQSQQCFPTGVSAEAPLGLIPLITWCTATAVRTKGHWDFDIAFYLETPHWTGGGGWRRQFFCLLPPSQVM